MQEPTSKDIINYFEDQLLHFECLRDHPSITSGLTMMELDRSIYNYRIAVKALKEYFDKKD